MKAWSCTGLMEKITLKIPMVALKWKLENSLFKPERKTPDSSKRKVLKAQVVINYAHHFPSTLYPFLSVDGNNPKL